jgi:hypothetical protein
MADYKMPTSAFHTLKVDNPPPKQIQAVANQKNVNHPIAKSQGLALASPD